MWDRPLSIAMLALGGQGGGVLTRWLVDIAEANDYLAQSTYVAGVAQRTGATVYCVEMFPQNEIKGRGKPVFTPYPVPGDVDLVIAGELAETGRAILKGFVTPNATTLIASSHRVYSIDEKSSLGDGIIDQSPVMKIAEQVSRALICFDMEQTADDCGSIVSAVMLGAIAASGVLPFARAEFEAAIRRGGKAVESNVRGFEKGYEAASSPAAFKSSPRQAELPASEGPNGDGLISRAAALPEPVRISASHGALRALEFQDKDFAEAYLARVEHCASLDSDAHEFALTESFARNLALQMCYEDTLRVAQLKTRASRFTKVRDHLGVAVDQPAYIVEYFHPRYEEVCDTLPAAVGGKMMTSPRLKRLFAPFFRRGINITTNKIGGYLLLAGLARMKRWRRRTYRYIQQKKFVGAWIEAVNDAVADDYSYALALVEIIEIVRGYGDTYERGRSRFERARQFAQSVHAERRADVLRSLHKAALADEDGARFAELIEELQVA